MTGQLHIAIVTSSIKLSYFKHLLWCLFWAAPILTPAFLGTVLIVVSWSPFKEMVGADALLIVASVADVRLVWKFTMRDQPRKPVGCYGLAAVTEHTIAMAGAYHAAPFPASISDGHLGPEIFYSFLKWNASPFRESGARAFWSSYSCHLPLLPPSQKKAREMCLRLSRNVRTCGS